MNHCPYCYSLDVEPPSITDPDADALWACMSCGNYFAAPVKVE